MKNIFIIILALGVYSGSVLAATITLKSGRTIQGKITERGNDYIRVNFRGVSLTYYLEDIEAIDGEKVTPLPIEREVSLKPFSDRISASQVFNEVAPATVVIIAYLPTGVSQGSGFIVDARGVVVTNFHVVRGAERIVVKLKDGRTYPVTGIIDYSPQKDICVLKIDEINLPTVRLGDSANLNPGQKVLVVGAPMGLEYSITDGLFSGVRREFGQRFIQFSAPISPGNSGGPLLDTSGKVIGVTTYTKIAGQNLNFAVPVNEVNKFIGVYPRISLTEFSTTIGKAYLLFDSGLQAFYSFKIDEAINYLQEAIRIDPNFLLAYGALGTIYFDLGMFDEVISVSEKAIRLDPDFALAHCNLGAAYGGKGIYNRAIEEIKKAVSIDPNAVSYSNLGTIYERLDMLDQAMESLKKAVSLDPYYDNAYKNLGWVYYRKGMIQNAIEETRRAILLNPNRGHPYYNLSFIYFHQGQYDLAVKYCDKAASLGQKIDSEFMEKLRPYRKGTFNSSFRGSDQAASFLAEARTRELRGDLKEAYRLSKNAFYLCSGINDAHCFQAFSEALRICSLLIAESAEKKDSSMFLGYSLDHIELVEKAGGLGRIIDISRKYAYSSNEFIDEMIEYTYSIGYFQAGIWYVVNNDLTKAYECLDKIRRFAPQNSALLERVIQERPSTYPWYWQ